MPILTEKLLNEIYDAFIDAEEIQATIYWEQLRKLRA